MGLAEVIGASLHRAPWGWVLTAAIIGLMIYMSPAIMNAVTRAREQMANRKEVNRKGALERISELEAKMEGYQSRVIDLERKFNTAIIAYRLIADELHRLEPDNPILRQAQHLLGAASMKAKTGNAGLDAYLDTLNEIPDVGAVQ